MDMLLMGLCMSLIGIAVTALSFAAATPPKPPAATIQPQIPSVKPAAVPARFFSDRVASPLLPPPQVPIEVLLQQIENHVRLEQAAAESFVAFPTNAQLHSKTTSSFLN